MKHAVKSVSLFLCCAALIVAGAPAHAVPGVPVTSDKAEVVYRDPDTFAETLRSLPRRTDWLDDLSGYIARRASRTLPSGERLFVTLTDVQRAGRVEPARNPANEDLRIVRNTTPPRIDLDFRLVATDGAVVKEGSRHLTDIAFLHRTGVLSSDPLSFEKRLIDDWMRADFGPVTRRR